MLTRGRDGKIEAKSIVSAAGGRLLALPISAVFAFLTARLIIRDSGVTVYALISLVLSLSLFLPISDLGVGAAIVNATAQSDRPEDDPHLHRVLLTSLRVLSVFTITLIAAAIAITIAHGWPDLLGVKTAKAQVNLATGVALSLIALSLPLGIGARVLLGIGRNGTLVLLQATGTPLAYLITVIAVHAQVGLVLLAAATPLGMLLSSLAQLIVARRLSRIDFLSTIKEVAYVKRFEGIVIRREAGPMVVISLGLPIALQTDRIILAHVSSLRQVALYALALQFYGPAWSLISASGLSLWPIFARQRLSGTGLQALRFAFVSFVGAGLVCGIALVALTPALSGLVGGNELRVTETLALCFGVLLLIQSAQLPLGMFLTSPRGLRFQAKCVAAMIPISIAVSLVLSKSLGAPGVVVGSIVAISACQLVPELWLTTRRPHTVMEPSRISRREVALEG